MKKIISKILTIGYLNFLLATQVFAQKTDLGTITGLSTAGEVTPDGTSVVPYASKLEAILSTVIGFLTIFGGIYFVINFILGGLNWASAGGDTGKVESAQKKMTSGLIGLVVMVSSYGIMYIIANVLGIDILNLGQSIEKIEVGK